MTEPTKFLWDNDDKRVKKIQSLDIPDSSQVGLAKVHADHLKKEDRRKVKRPRRV